MDSVHDKYANDYDEQIIKYNCQIAEVLFGLGYEFITRGETILDVGIGTGVSARLFFTAGLHVFGIDGSGEMLKICKKKEIADELLKQDILVFPWPYQDNRFDHVICCGVFHFIGDLDNLFEEISRIHNPGGIFAFTVMNGDDAFDLIENYEHHVEDDLEIFSHKVTYIDNLIVKNKYQKEKEIISLVGQTQFRAIIARKTES